MVQQQHPDDPPIAAERWNRTDWWGVVLDTDDVETLARFYSELRGWAIWKLDPDDGAALDLGEGVAYLAIQYDAEYRAPVWPARGEEQRMMVHLDFQVTDLHEETRRALDLGASLPDFQPQDDVRVMLDPSGHPFCLHL